LRKSVSYKLTKFKPGRKPVGKESQGLPVQEETRRLKTGSERAHEIERIEEKEAQAPSLANVESIIAHHLREIARSTKDEEARLPTAIADAEAALLIIVGDTAIVAAAKTVSKNTIEIMRAVMIATQNEPNMTSTRAAITGTLHVTGNTD
jgi:flagellar motor protein MotB